MNRLAILALLASGCIPASGAPYVEPDGPRPVEVEAAESRGSCAYARGMFPSQTVGSDALPDEMPIDHIIVLMMENRSFDHYFSDDLPLGSYTGPSPNHSWIGTHVQMLEGFPEEARVRLEMPYYRELYGAWASSDAHFSALPGPTWPNRYMLLAGSSYGMIENGIAPPMRVKQGGHLFEQLDRASVPWKVYYSDVPFALGALPTYSVQWMGNFRPLADMYRAFESGDLPGFTLIEPGYIGPDRTDEHAPADPRQGMRFVQEVVEAVMASPAWERSALIITYDEHGGFYDRVAPPVGCDPGDWPVPEGNPGHFGERGFRVPMVVISPWARRGYVSHQVTDATSVLRLVQTRFHLPALTGRDANAWPLLDMFNFERTP